MQTLVIVEGKVKDLVTLFPATAPSPITVTLLGITNETLEGTKIIVSLVSFNNNPFSKEAQYINNNETLGIINYSIIYERMEIDNVFIKEDYRGKGIGTKLMSYLVYEAIHNKVVNITLEVRVSNTIAINLYKKFGFREVAIRKYYYGDEDAILMEKQVM